jgi:magnesium transporter
MIRILYRHRSSGIVAELPVEKLQTAVQDKFLNLWVDMLDPTPEEYQLVFEQIFRFHPLAIEDATQDSHIPKVDDYGSYLFVVIHTVVLGGERMDLETREMDIFLGPNYLITSHDERRAAIDRCWQIDFHDKHGLARGPAYLLYELLDRQIDTYIPIIDEFEMRLEHLGDEIFRDGAGSSVQVLDQILTAKSSALRMHRILAPQRELIYRLATSDYAVIPSDLRIYFRDVHDHLVRLASLSEGMRDLAGSTIETHLALANNRMNEVIKLLTIISTIFIPLSFVAGVYGMNFKHMPELEWRFGYLFVWLIFLAIGGGLLYLFWRRGWLSQPDGTGANAEGTFSNGAHANGAHANGAHANSAHANGAQGNSAQANGAQATRAARGAQPSFWRTSQQRLDSADSAAQADSTPNDGAATVAPAAAKGGSGEPDGK